MSENNKPVEAKEEKAEIVPIKANGRGLQLLSIEDMYRFAKYVVASKLAPKSFQTPEQIIIAVQSGAELAMPPMRSLQSFCVINGAARLYGDAPLALVKQSGLLEYIKEWFDGEGEDMIAWCETKRKDDAESVKRGFSVDDAKTAGLWKKVGPWQTYPKRMLQMRARGLNLRDCFPDCFGGATIAEEFEGVEMPAEAVTPQVGSREDRKQVDAKVTDTAEAVKEQLEKCLDKFMGCAEYGLDSKLESVPGAVLNELFAKFAWLILNPDNAADAPDYQEVGSYDLEKLGLLMTSLEDSGIPDSVLAMFPAPPMTEEEVTEHAEDKLKDYGWTCLSVACGEKFDKPKGTKRKPICPKCLTANISKNEVAEVKK